MTDITGHYAMVRGVKAYYERAGSGETVLLMHTAGRDARQWHGVMERMKGDFDVIAADLPGHGRSWPLEGNRCLEEIVDIASWLRELVQTIGVRRFAVMGCSLGGNLALLMPALFDEIWGAVSMQGGILTPAWSQSGLDLFLHPQINWMHANMDISLSLMGSKCAPEGKAWNEWTVTTINPFALKADLTAFSSSDTGRYMEKVRCPVLLAHGTEDWIVPRAMVDEARDALVNAQGAKVVSIPGIGHFPHLEAPDEVARLALDFFRDHAPA